MKKKNFYRESLEELNQKKNIESESTKPLSEKIDNIAKLKASVVNRFEKENGVLSLTLQSTEEWEEKDDTLYITCGTAFDISILKNNLHLISEYINSCYIKKLKVEVVKEKITHAKEESAEPSIFLEKNMPSFNFLNMVIDMFDGELINGA